MEIHILRNELNIFKEDIFRYLKEEVGSEKPNTKRWLRSREVMKMLSISSSHLQSMRATRVISFSRLENTYFYDAEEILKLLKKNFSPAK